MKSLLETIARTVTTPFFLYHESMIQSRIEDVLHVFSAIDFRPTFAVKANANPFLLSVFQAYGIGADFISRGEFEASRAGGIPTNQMTWNGNVKSEEDMLFFSKQHIQNVNIDSIYELQKWGQLKSNHDLPLPSLFLRINPSIEVSTHPYIKTGMKQHKFGISLNDIDFCLRTAQDYGLTIRGFHIHIGSQITDSHSFEKAYSYISKLSQHYGFSDINIGGGWGIPYFEKNHLDLKHMKSIASSLFSGFCIWCELGRYLIGEAGWYIVRACENRDSETETMCITDGGMNHLLRPSLYKAHHSFSSTDPIPQKKSVRIMGRLCETGDILVPSTVQNCPAQGSLIAIHQSGAYGFSMSNHYNGFPLPAEVFLSQNGKWKIIRKAESNTSFLEQCLQGEHYDITH
jgi:diaminopimelate decarboxylase